MREYFAQVDENDVVVSVHNEEASGLIKISRNQAIEIAKKTRFDFSKVIELDGIVSVSDNQDGIDVFELVRARAELITELEHLEVATARGFLWLVKLLTQNGTIQQSDIHPKLLSYKDRIEEIEAELNQ